MKPCKHLDYDNEFLGCEIRTLPGGSVRYWLRLNPPDEGAPDKVQVCRRGGGYINDIFSCYVGHYDCYEPD